MAKGWFGPKRAGFGISPRSWQAWLVLLAWAASLVAANYFLVPALAARFGAGRAPVSLLVAVLWIAGIIVVSSLTYSPDA